MKRLVGTVAAVVLLAGACSGDDAPRRQAGAEPAPTSSTTSTTTTSTSTSTTTSSTTTTTTPPPPPSPPPPPQGLGWKACGNLQCTTLAVPFDYANPSGPTLGLALARRPARSPATRIGSLLINPGGPGDSGIDDLPAELRVLSSSLQARFDIVSWDPRGVGRSAPVRCSPAGAAPASPAAGGDPLEPVPVTDTDRQTLLDAHRAYAAACAEHSGDLLRVVGNDSTVEDLERIRAALGEEQLSFIGHSSGTLLGTVYADRYPHRVRAMVLDGVIDPSLDLHGMTQAQALSFERTLTEFFNWCTATATCAWRPGPDLRSSFMALLDRIRQQPLSAPGNVKVGVSKLMNGVMGRLYVRKRWPSLGDALAAAERGDGGPLAGFASGYVNHGASNAADARMAITCLDHPTARDPEAYPSLAAEAATQAPVFGPLFTWGELGCGVWPHRPTLEPRPVRAGGSAPILVIGTTGDPATPRAWAEAVARQLERGVLVIRQGEEHVAYYYSACVRALVDAYLVDGRAPANPTTCTR